VPVATCSIGSLSIAIELAGLLASPSSSMWNAPENTAVLPWAITIRGLSPRAEKSRLRTQAVGSSA
jgi:hypothetical protein